MNQHAQLVQTLVRLLAPCSPLAPADKLEHCSALASLASQVPEPVHCAADDLLEVTGLTVQYGDGVDVTAESLHSAVPVPVAAPLTLVLVCSNFYVFFSFLF